MILQCQTEKKLVICFSLNMTAGKGEYTWYTYIGGVRSDCRALDRSFCWRAVAINWVQQGQESGKSKSSVTSLLFGGAPFELLESEKVSSRRNNWISRNGARSYKDDTAPASAEKLRQSSLKVLTSFPWHPPRNLPLGDRVIWPQKVTWGAGTVNVYVWAHQ
jgi:hypothetical protein